MWRSISLTFLAILASTVSFESVSETNKKISVITRILEVLKSEETSVEMFCSLKIIVQSNSTNLHFPLDWVEWSEQENPLEIFQLEEAQYVPPCPKFMSNCYNNIVSLTSKQILTTGLAHLGRALHDRYIFVSQKEKMLLEVMNSKNVLDAVAHKYGVVVSPTVENKLKLTYFVEPASFTGKLIKLQTPLTSRKTNNLFGRSLKIAFMNVRPHFESIGDGKYRGSQYSLLQAIAQRQNISLTIYNNTRTPGFGYRMLNGSWSGVIDEVGSGRADLTPTISASLQRYSYVSYSTVSYVETLVLFLREPGAHREWHALIDPLSPMVWLYTLISFLAVVLLLILKVVLEGTLDWKGDFSEVSWGNMGVTVALLCYAHCLEQSVGIPKYLKARKILLMWIFLSGIIGTAYKSNLVTFLTFTQKDIVPRTFEQLYNVNKDFGITLYTLGGMEQEIFKTSPSPVIKGIVKRMSVTRSMLDCLLKACKPRQVCIGWNGIVGSEIVKSSVRVPALNTITVTTDPGGIAYGSFGFKKNSIYSESFTKFIGPAMAGNLREKWRSLDFAEIRREGIAEHGGKGLHNAQQQEGAAHKLSNEDLLIVFAVIVVGLLIGSMGFILETLYYSVSDKM